MFTINNKKGLYLSLFLTTFLLLYNKNQIQRILSFLFHNFFRFRFYLFYSTILQCMYIRIRLSRRAVLQIILALKDREKWKLTSLTDKVVNLRHLLWVRRDFASKTYGFHFIFHTGSFVIVALYLLDRANL